MATSTLELEYVVRGYHEYMRYWTPEIGEILSTQIEATNPHNLYAVAVVSGELGVVGHVPRKISKLCNSFLARGGTIEVQVLGRRKRSNLPQGGLDVPCILTFTGKQQLVRRLQKALKVIEL